MTQRLGDRTKYLGATDIPAILGLSPWRTAYEVWLEKTGRFVPGELNDQHVIAGTTLQSGILELARQTRGFESIAAPEDGVPIRGTPIIVHPDALTPQGEPVEVKTSGLFGPVVGEWGPDGTDEVPDGYLVQLHTQIAALGASGGFIIALLGGVGLRIYEAKADPELARLICGMAKSWWEEFVVADREPPLDVPPPVSVLQRLRRVPRKSVDLPSDVAELVDEYQALGVQISDLQRRRDELKSRIILALGDAEMGRLPDGRAVTYYEKHVPERVVRAYSYRELRIKAQKGGKHVS
ncbi:MAG: hypothetical protein RMJ19_05525 [Gemmatales bacterium]|nr:hypothetical protein [Gemmatales bacterium]MDW8175113.1 hypothetical protein [Gemmatales bacterium]